MLVAHVHDQWEWFKESLQLVKEMSIADCSNNRWRKIEILFVGRRGVAVCANVTYINVCPCR